MNAVRSLSAAALTLLSFSLHAACPEFRVAPVYKAHATETSGPTGVVSADFNGDNKKDLAVANQLYATVSILIGNGDGTFAAAVTIGDGYGKGIAAGDFNNDGKKDLAVTRATGGVDIMLGNGNGTFAAAVNYATGGNPYFVAIGFFNNDANADLAVANYNDSTVSILLGNGNGTFGSATPYSAGNSPDSIAVADMNADNKTDLVIGNYFAQTVSVLLGNNDGTFGAPAAFGVSGEYTTGVAVGDFNGDNKKDIAATNQEQAFILIGNGDGTFVTAVPYVVGATPHDVAVVDVNGDNKADLITANGGTNDITVFFGNGDGTVANARHFGSGTDPVSLAIDDYNADNKKDVAVANFTSNDVAILIGNGDGSFVAREDYGKGDGRYPIVADFNNDGNLDLAAMTQQNIRVLIGLGNGRFNPAVVYNAGATTLQFMATGDFNGDGYKDLVTSDGNLGVNVILNNGNGTFGSPNGFNAGIASFGTLGIAVGDFNNDARLDLAVAVNTSSPGTISILLGNGNGTFGAKTTFATGDYPNEIAVADFNHDGKLDLATANYVTGSGGNVSVLLGNGNGTFGAATSYATGTLGNAIITADFNNDGIPDLVSNGGRNISIQIGNGNGTFGAATMYPADQQALYLTELASGDFNGDGKLDVAAGAIIVPGNGDGTFGAPITTYTSGIPVYALPAAGDLNNDGKTDLVVLPYTTDADVLLNISTCAWPTIPTGVAATAITSTRVDLSWPAVSGATSYQIDRKGAGGGYAQIGTSATNSYSDTTASSSTSYLYRVRALIGANASGSSAPDLATTVIFTDDPLSAGVIVKAAHLSQLRTAAGAVRTLAGLSAATFTDSASTGTTIKAIHITELRAAIDAARVALALANNTYTNASLTGAVIRAVHFTELRSRVK